MKTRLSTNSDPISWLLRTRPAEDDPMDGFPKAKAEPKSLRATVTSTGHPLGWIERTLLAVDGHRVFIDVADARLREELIAANEALHHDVIAASNSEALLQFIAHLPVPRGYANDVVIAEEDTSGTKAKDLDQQLRARGWSIPVLTVSARTRLGALGVTS
jgi:hypothetical protein